MGVGQWVCEIGCGTVAVRRSEDSARQCAPTTTPEPRQHPLLTHLPHTVAVGQEENEGFKKGRAWEVEIRSVRVKADRPDLLPRSVTIDVKASGWG